MKTDIENKSPESDSEKPEAPFSILPYTDTELRKTCNKVKFIDDEILKIIGDMAKTMIACEGLGLAAPQVGINRRFFLFLSNPENIGTEKEVEVTVAINPQILERDGESIIYEGCLSYPDYLAKVKRALKIKVRYQDLDMNKVEEEFFGLSARIFQHELDHLDGILFIDRMEPDTLKHADEIEEGEEKTNEKTTDANL